MDLICRMTERLHDAVPVVSAQQILRKGELWGEAAAAHDGWEWGRSGLQVPGTTRWGKLTMCGQLAKNVVLFMSSPEKEERAFIQRRFKKKQELEKENYTRPQHTSAPGNVPSQEGSKWLTLPALGGCIWPLEPWPLL